MNYHHRVQRSKVNLRDPEVLKELTDALEDIFYECCDSNDKLIAHPRHHRHHLTNIPRLTIEVDTLEKYILAKINTPEKTRSIAAIKRQIIKTVREGYKASKGTRHAMPDLGGDSDEIIDNEMQKIMQEFDSRFTKFLAKKGMAQSGAARG